MLNERFCKRKFFLGIALSCSLVVGGTIITGCSEETNIEKQELSKEQVLNEIKPVLEKYINALNAKNSESKKACTTEKFLEDKRNLVFETMYEGENYNKTIQNVTIDEIISETEIMTYIEYDKGDENSMGLIKENNEWKIESVDFEVRKTDNNKYSMTDVQRDSKLAHDEMTKFLEGKYTVIVNSGMDSPIKLPDTFEATKGGVEVGKISKEINDISINNGLDFQNYLGKNVYMFCVALENESSEAVVLISEGKLIGKAIIPVEGKGSSVSILMAKLNIQGE